MVSINYHTTAETLTCAFFLCFEIFSETGMFPTTLELNEGATLVKFDRKDARRCVQGVMTEEEYIKANAIRRQE